MTVKQLIRELIDPTLDALSQAGFRPQVITTGEKQMVVIPGAKA